MYATRHVYQISNERFPYNTPCVAALNSSSFFYHALTKFAILFFKYSFGFYTIFLLLTSYKYSCWFTIIVLHIFRFFVHIQYEPNKILSEVDN